MTWARYVLIFPTASMSFQIEIRTFQLETRIFRLTTRIIQFETRSKKTSNDQELTQPDPTSCPQNQKGNN